TMRPTVRMAIFSFDDNVVNIAGSLAPLTPKVKQTLIQSLLGDGEQASPRLDFQSQRSNIPAALVRAMRELQEKGQEGVRKSIVLISDGVIQLQSKDKNRDLEDWIKTEFTLDAQSAHIRLYGIALSRKANFDLFHSMAIETDGAFYPVFESKMGVRIEDLVGAMENLKQSAGSHLVSPLKQITITDQSRGIRYTLTKDKDGIRLRATLQDHTLTPEGLSELGNPWREIFRGYDLELSPEATVRPVSDGRWEVQDPYHYTISRRGDQLQIRLGSKDSQEGLSGLLETDIISIIWDDRTDWGLMGLFGVLLVYWLLVDINLTAAHSFYRDRLSKAYLFRVPRSGVVEHFDQQKLSDLNTEGSVAPYHLINVALNLQGSKDPSLRGRNTDFFLFSKRFTGSLRTGFLETKEMEGYDGHLNLGTAMAISGAAAAPNMGVTTLKSLVFVMTLLNIRLGYWLPNPQMAKGASWLTRLALRRGPGPKYVLKESLGRLNLDGQFINVSDGGHIENLGVYELLRRRCTFIISVDGGKDSNVRFGSLVKLLLYARIDMGIEIDIDLDSLRKDEQGLSSTHWAHGTIRYADGKTGYLLYIKSSVTGDEYEYVREYRERNPEFPHESTADQFFDETRFEAYRALGYHIGDQLFSHDDAMGEFRTLKT
ncbi:MAG: vWA domain-containing protein, partial [Acidobacteriota bacterium]